MRTLFLTLLFFPILSFGQNINDTDIIKDYCKRVKEIDWENKTNEEITYSLSQIAINLRYDHLESINSLKKEIKVVNPNFTEKDLDKEFTIKLIESLVDNCETYMQLTRNLMRPCPKSNKTLEIIAKKIDSIIDQNQNLSYPELLNAADNQIFNIIVDNEKQVNKDYKDGFADPRLADDVGIYLLYNSKSYYKAYVLSESIKMFN